MGNKTEVIFRKFKDGEIIALFPYEVQDRIGLVMSYMHNGQHSDASLNIIEITKLATPSEYEDLKTELESIGYNLKICKRVNTNKWSKARDKRINKLESL